MLDSYDSLEDLLRLRFSSGRRDDSGTIDEINPTHQRDVLPDLRLSRDGRSLADGLLLERIDDRGFTDVGVSDESDRNLLFVGEQGGELTEELDERSFTERVVDRGVEGDGRMSLGENLDPTSLQIENRKSQQSSSKSTDEMMGMFVV